MEPERELDKYLDDGPDSEDLPEDHPPRNMGDLFVRQKPGKLEELDCDEKFEKTAESYFEELGHTHIFNIALVWSDDATYSKVQEAFDTIYAQLFYARSRIGQYHSAYLPGQGNNQTVEKCFSKYIMSLRLKKTSNNWALHMRNFIDVTEQELEYLESQIKQAHSALFKPEKCFNRWNTETDPVNLIAQLPNHMESTQKSKQIAEHKRHLNVAYLKCVLFKAIVCIERLDYYVTGRIKGRSAYLEPLDAHVKDMIPSKDEKDPLSPQVLQVSRRVHKVFNDFNDATETDIKHTHRLQSAIW